VLFAHDAVFVAAAKMFTITNLQKMLSIHFVGPKGGMDQLMQETWNATTLLARPFVLYQWMLVLREINDWYKAIILPKYHEFERRIELANAQIMKHAAQSCSEIDL
jgi:hypothetical protein